MKALLFALFLCLSAIAAQAERRVALVIGNSAYRFAPELRNPANDARAMGEALQRLGFQVLAGSDLDIDAMRRLLRDFSLQAEGADLALFFYAGHGLQVAGSNYLIPVDAALEREGDLDFAAIDLALVMKQLELATGSAVVLLDACRDNPFETRLSRSMGQARSTAALGRGLAPVETLGGALIGFATDPGEVAYDGEGAHSPFTTALLAHIETPGLEINAMLTRVRADVVSATGRLQRPWSTSSLLTELYLAPVAQNPTTEADPLLAEIEAWKAADQAGTAEALEGYLRTYPDGIFADLAQGRLAGRAGEAPSGSLTAALDVPPELSPLQPLPQLDPDAPARSDAPGLLPDADATKCELCPRTVALPGGQFLMGSTSEASTAAERPVQQITLAPFRMSVAEVTVGEFRRFVQAADYRPTPGCYVWTDSGKMRFRDDASWQEPGFPVTEDMPVACVSWQDAQAYIGWLSARTGLAVSLPSEAQLEYAIRAGSTADFPFAGGASAACGRVNAADSSSRFAWRNTECDDGFSDLAPANAFPPNDFGLTSITGNLWEWAADCWNGSLKGMSADGAPRQTGDCASRALRGGSWDDPVKNLRSSYRVGIPGKRRQANVGFRIVIAP